METGFTRCKEVWMCGFQGTQNPIRFPVTMAKGIHLFPYRTQKLSLSAPMVLGWRRPGRVGRCRIPQRKASDECLWLFLCVSGEILLPAHLRRSQRTYLVRIFPAARSAGCRQEKSPGRVGGRARKRLDAFCIISDISPMSFLLMSESTC